MRFDKKKNPAGVCAEAGSYRVTGVAAVALEGLHYLASTDGRALVLIAAEPSPADLLDANRVYPAAAIAAARKAFGSIDLHSDGAAVPGVASFPALAERFPSLDGIVPTGKPEHVFCLDAELLARIQRALGAGGVQIYWHGDDKPMVIRPIPIGGKKARKSSPIDGSFGVMMPLWGEA